jgi:hypothetical protein
MRNLALVLSALGLGVGCSATSTNAPFSVDGGAEAASSSPDDEGNDVDDGTPDDDAATGRDAGPKSDATASTTVVGCGRATSKRFVVVDNAPNGSLPAPAGGSIADGHYVLAEATVMSSIHRADIAADLWLGGGRYEWQLEDADGWHYSYGGKFAKSGTHLNMPIDCGGQTNPLGWDYSTNGKRLEVQFTNENGFAWLYVLERE